MDIITQFTRFELEGWDYAEYRRVGSKIEIRIEKSQPEIFKKMLTKDPNLYLPAGIELDQSRIDSQRPKIISQDMVRVVDGAMFWTRQVHILPHVVIGWSSDS